jgi:hypothetical protein
MMTPTRRWYGRTASMMSEINTVAMADDAAPTAFGYLQTPSSRLGGRLRTIVGRIPGVDHDGRR